MSASSSITVKENIAALKTLKVMTPKAANNNKGRHDLSVKEKKKACHQCRQMTANLSGACKSNRNNRPCTISYCARCLLNRYGEQEVEHNEDCWICPKCRGICNCSCCRKKKGEMPTGKLIHIAKDSGYASVHELLQNRGGADLIELLSPIPKRRTKRSYKPNKHIIERWHIIERPPLTRADDNVITNGSQQATSNAGAQVAEDDPVNATARFRLFGRWITIN